MHEGKNKNANQEYKQNFRKQWKEHIKKMKKEKSKSANRADEKGRASNPTKIRLLTKPKITASNIKGINTLGKRKEHAQQWEKQMWTLHC